MTRSTSVAVLSALVLAAAACGRADESLAKRTGEKVGETVTDFGTGIGAGIDSALKPPVAIETAPAAAALGLSTTVSKWDGRALSVYVIATDPVAVSLVAKAMNRAGEEIGRAKLDASFGKEDARYVRFEFPEETDVKIVARCVVDVAR
jgi:hypothetical protein